MTIAEFMSIILDTTTIEARLPPDKLLQSQIILDALLQKSSCSRTKFELLISFLSYAAKIIFFNRVSLRRLYNLQASFNF